ncbi:MAG TPA: histone deacetylase [Polyangiaceae bacterium]|nr:histone deacetylase [Polyangiaceae bacterium]
MALHDPGPGHPERPQRLHAARTALEDAEGLEWREAEPVTREQLVRVHTEVHVDRIESFRGKTASLDPDTSVSERSVEAACLAAGAGVTAVDEVMAGEERHAFVLARPPGHHAEPQTAMGFCLYNNVALAAEALRIECGVARLAIVDWDVHHGNGTQHIFEDDPDVLFVSLHGHPDALYPGTGYAHERGRGRGEGATLNVPLEPGTGDGAYRRAFEAQVRPVIERFGPEVVLISCGFDAHKDDPLGILELTDETFAWLTNQVLALADRCAQGRIVSVLEGGYDLRTLARCATAHARQLARA